MLNVNYVKNFKNSSKVFFFFLLDVYDQERMYMRFYLYDRDKKSITRITLSPKKFYLVKY